MNISEIITEGENTKVELKEIMNDKAYKTLSAFSNTKGGTFLCGVNDNGQVVGFDCSDEPVRDVTTKIVNSLGIQPLINCFEFEGKKILRVDVKKSVNPIAYRGKYYKRVGSTTMEMQGEELRNFFLRGTNWDAITGNYTLDEIDEKTVDKFVNRAIKKGRLPDGQTDNLKETLKKLNLIINDKLTNAAIILFGKNPQQYFTNALIRVITFKGNINTSDKIISGNLFNQVEEAEKAIKSSLNVRHEVKGKLTRNDIWDYPLEAVRESLLNAIIHRDYFKYGIQTQIKISEDNIWFFNPGGLIGGLTIESLKKSHPSAPRNPLIADVLYHAGYVEVYGSGMGRILASFKGAGLPEPDFKEEFEGFSLYMFKGYTEDMLRKMALNERQIKAMALLNKKGSISTKEYSKIVTDVTIGTVRRDLTDLIDKGLIVPVGPKKTRRYKLK